MYRIILWTETIGKVGKETITRSDYVTTLQLSFLAE